MIPFENTSRSPRFVNWRAKNRSRASSAASRGNPWKLVFAASTSTASVSTWTTQYMNPLHVPAGKTPRAISDSTDGVPVAVGAACICTASHETPRNIAIAIAPRIASVIAAFLPCGFLNALTPFAIASTPVSAVEPDANARRTTNRVTAPAPGSSGCGTTALRARARRRTAPKPTADQDEDRRHERVGRDREQDARLAHAAQVGERDQRDAGERQRQLVPLQARHRRGQREHAGGDRDRDGEDVVGEQRRRRDEAREPAEVLLRDDVRAARALVDEHRLPVREHDDREQHGDPDRDREHQMRGAGRGADEHDQRRLGGVRDRRERVGGEDRQREELREERLLHLPRRHRAPDQQPLGAPLPRRRWRPAHPPMVSRSRAAASARSPRAPRACSTRA